MESVTLPKASNYWNVFMHMDDSEKIDLIFLLLKSLKHEKAIPTTSPSDFYGIWGDDGMSDEQFLKELKSLRNFNQEIVEI